MEEEDIRALSCWRRGDPNFQDDLFQNTAMDRILSNSFIDFGRVHKLFDTKARPRRPQINLPQPQDKVNVYVPGGRISIECSQRSQLNACEQKEYLRLFLLLKYQGKNALQKQEENTFSFLHQKVVEEHPQYEAFVEALVSTAGYTFNLQESIRLYTSQAWQFRLAEVEEYPTWFKMIATLPLVSHLDGSRVKMKLENNILELGKARSIFPPQFKSKLCCSDDYDNLCKNYPVARSVRKMCPVSRDPAAEELALGHGADIVISSSALQHLADNYPNYDRVWDIPVVIKKLEHGVVPGKTRKIIFIDKALPPAVMAAEERNLWFHKIVVKRMFFNQDDNYVKCPAKRPSFVIKKHCKKGTKNLHVKKYSQVDIKSAPDDILHSDTCDSEGDDVETKELKKNVPVDESTDPEQHVKLSNDMCGLDLNSDMYQRGVKRKPVDTSGTSLESNCDENESSGSDCEGKLLIDCDDDKVCDEQVKAKKSVRKEVAAKKKRTSDCDSSKTQGLVSTEPIQPFLDGQCAVQCHSAILEETVSSGDAGPDEPMKMPCEEQIDEPVPESPVEPSQPHVVYSMWQMCLREAEKEDLKERILKKKIDNKYLRILVRCKVDGVKTAERVSQKLCIVPKLEHKAVYGAERLSASEIIRSWVMLYFRPGVNLARVRVDNKTSEVLMFEETNLQEVVDHAVFSKIPVKSLVLGTLFNVLTALDNYEPGTYLMSHRRDSFFNFLKAVDENGLHNLRKVYQINCNEVTASRPHHYLPIDTSVVMPRNIICGRVPGTFNPKKNENLVRTKKKKKKMWQK